MALQNLRDWNVGDSVRSAAHHQQAVDALRELAARTRFPDREPASSQELRLAKIVATGPAGAADFTDERYWITPHFVKSADYSAQIETDVDTLRASTFAAEVGSATSLPNAWAATNIQELAGHTHALQVGDFVLYWQIRDAGDPSVLHYVFLPAPAGPVIVRVVDSTSTGNGVYNGKIRILGTAAFDPTTNLTASAFGSDGADCVIVNMNEISGSGHWLTAAGNSYQRYFLGRVIGTSTTGKPVVAINGLWAKACA